MLLQQAFPWVSVKELYATLEENGECLYPSILAMDKIMADYDYENPPFKLKKRPLKANPAYKQENIEDTIRECNNAVEKEALVEFREATKARILRQAKSEAKLRLEKEESDNYDRAKAEGTLAECECCCDQFALNRMVHCNSETLHVRYLLGSCSCSII